jgi:hypothetical protein
VATRLTRKDLTSETWKRIVAFVREREAQHMTSLRSLAIPERSADAVRGRLAELNEILALDPRVRAPGPLPPASEDAGGDPFERTLRRAEED